MYKVFIVDDEPFIIEGLYDAVDWSAFGLEMVGSAENGVQALDRLRETPVDILLTDISMPQMNGLELIREARRFRPALKAIVLSGYNEFDFLKEGMKLGIENYLLKPVHFGELQGTLTATVEKLDREEAEREWGGDEIGILRDNVMLRWLAGRIAPPELAERAALLRIDLSKPFVAVAVVRAEGGTEPAYATAERLLRDEASVILFRDLEDNAVLAFPLEKAESGKREAREKLERLARRWEDEAERKTGAGRPRIAVGAAVRMDEARVSYDGALKAQPLFLVQPDRSLLDYERLPPAHAAAEPEEAWLDWDAYAKRLAAKDGGGLRAQLEEDFARLRDSGAGASAQAKGDAVELIVRMKMEADKLGRTDKPDVYKAALDRALRADTLEEIEEAAQEAASATIDSFGGEDMSPVVRQVLRHVQDHYADPLTLKTLAREFNIHPVYLGHLFHKQTGDSFTDYINKFRIDKAKELLRDSRLKVNEIARSVGYWETGYFYKQFKKYVGVPPSEYKGLL